MFYLTFEGYRFGVFIVIVYKAPVSLKSGFKTSYSPDSERADFNRQSFQYTWLNNYFFSSLQEFRPTILRYEELLGSCDRVRSLLQQLSLNLWYLVSFDTALWYSDSILTLSIPATTLQAITVFFCSRYFYFTPTNLPALPIYLSFICPFCLPHWHYFNFFYST